jgi:hypothetical protein
MGRGRGIHKLTSAIITFDRGRVHLNEKGKVSCCVLILLELQECVPSEQKGFGIVRIDLSDKEEVNLGQ